MIPFLGFCPDIDPATPGVITDCTQLIPTEKGMAGAPSPVASGADVLVDDARGAAVLKNTSGTTRTIVGTQLKLYELTSTTWTDVSTGTYTGSSENRWSFAQFGNLALASNDTDAIQLSTAATFATISGAPKAMVIVTSANFVLAFNTSDATYGDEPDRWRCSAYQDATSWTVNVTTQAATGRLIGSGGEITAAARFGQQVVAYKSTDLFLGTYTGPPYVWQWDQIPGDVGCVGPEALCDIGGAHVFVGEDNIWLYDGTRPVPIAQAIRQWFFDDSSTTYRYRSILTYDRQNARVWLFYCSTSNVTGTPDSAIVWHRFTKQWGRANRVVEAAFRYVTPGLTWEGIEAISVTWDALPDIPWDSQSWQSSGRALGIFDSDHRLQLLTGSSVSSGLSTGDYGDDWTTQSIRALKLRFITNPTTGTVSGSTKVGAGESFVTGGSGTLSDSKFDIRQTGRFHRLDFTFTGDMETTGLAIDFVNAGRR